ncbi:hypothetical protein HBI56_036940 [Parastagonospora nodorum]|uniref:Uncharacterized protein n=1 Tax=Phaeosphaeria nodorum (strain SN15 / ATCC MYA-4574 / FGSC 10173) TaxID=321614 RepID=A0A7U2EYZ2_PHANO|nr:hypothetical protein HBH56_069860 [Parastagonospora nodorum]QRC93620.1 hypothetical protein JI435_038210 [Parastagonospora nodorum SN15]KAH3932224.1 hypothetical protein HBH54_078260 [Parastagonospora nodorum]KAH3954569.1 hypothetical protein HBH53_016100 [Parastagonospora nodorum]KAH3986308.1 hypothetical protein HBH52_047260 [Parastagonospora nodorum]
MADSTKACEERFLQVREASLRQWFSETRSNDLNTRLTAQDRLHVLLIIRKHRGKLAKLEEQKTRTNGYGAQTATERWAQILRGEKTFTGADVEQWAGRWKTKMTLQKLLMNDTYDTPADFHCTSQLGPSVTDPSQDRFHRIRDDKLRTWYAEAMSTHVPTRNAASKRLQLQRNIRTYRIYLGDCKERCNTCKRNNDKAGATTAQQDIYRVNGRIQYTCLSMREGQELSRRQNVTLLRQWEEDTPTEEDILIGLQHDRVEDFGVIEEEEEW